MNPANATSFCAIDQTPCQNITTCCNDGRDIEMMSWGKWIPWVRAYTNYRDKGGNVLTAPDDMIGIAVRQAAADFSRETRVLRRIAKMDIQKGVRDYYVKPLDGERISLVDVVCVDGERLEPIRKQHEWSGYPSLYNHDNGYYSHDNGYSCFHRKYGSFTWNIPDKLVLTNEPCIENKGAIFIEYHASVSEDACQVDSMLYERYREGIQRRAIETILSIPGYEWARPDFAIDSARRAEIETTRAKIDVMRGYASGHESVIKGRRW